VTQAAAVTAGGALLLLLLLRVMVAAPNTLSGFVILIRPIPQHMHLRRGCGCGAVGDSGGSSSVWWEQGADVGACAGVCGAAANGCGGVHGV
jgi:hypothetical protein